MEFCNLSLGGIRLTMDAKSLMLTERKQAQREERNYGMTFDPAARETIIARRMGEHDRNCDHRFSTYASCSCTCTCGVCGGSYESLPKGDCQSQHRYATT